jgi:hypothetical protein
VSEPNEEAYSNLGIKDLISLLSAARADLDDLDERKKIAKKRYDYLSQVIVPERMDAEGLKQITIEGIGRVNIRSDIYCNTPSANRELVKEWLREHDLEDIITETVNGSTLKAFVKEQMQKRGGEYPDMLLSITPYSLAVITKG